ncbi:unnamed protein product [Prorocentrum cordatum]|uniref:Serine/threonine-protein kinase BSK1-like TPR repeats domain-containing protein n=1 Tax=Prorocentrum cordatum TaxID=2364126 RepID=A0ABN9VXT7_9DINO|nr:unnamed protein product [Polarella glacialis]
MTDKEKAAAAKAKGNAAFQAKNFEEAIKHFTEAISHDATDHVFFSNRSACYSSLEKYEKALEDGTKCVTLKPDWPKGYTRKGLAEFFLRKYDESAETYKAGLKLAPEDPAMKEGLSKAMDAKYEVPGAGAGGARPERALAPIVAAAAVASAAGGCTNVVLKSNGYPEISEADYKKGTRYVTPERFGFHVSGDPRDAAGPELGRQFDDLYVTLVSPETTPMFPGLREFLSGASARRAAAWGR